MVKIKSLEGISIEELYDSFKEAFIDYEMQLNQTEFYIMITRRGFNGKLSFGAFDNNKLVSFTLFGYGNYYGKKSVYDTGTGTIKEYRNLGLASKIFEYSLPFLKNEGVEQIILEVLQHNKKAVSLYKRLGFNISREFNYYIQTKNDLTVKKTAIINEEYELLPLSVADIEPLTGFSDFEPSWQNSIQSVSRRPDDFIIKGLYHDKKVIAYIIIDPTTGDITQIAVVRNYRRKGLGSYLLGEGVNLITCKEVKIINTESNCVSISKFLESNSFSLSGKQYEMIKLII